MSQALSSSLQIGDTIDGKYEIIRLLGEGGMGCVFEGRNLRIGRRVAIKVLHAPVAENLVMQQRFELEAQAAARIGSDHIIDVLDLGELPTGDRYMVMEFLDGQSLADRLDRPMAPEEAFPIFLQLLDGLGDAHAAGIVHRDLKPDNIFLLRQKKKQADYVKILDFGISKFRVTDESNANLTQTGAVLGTPYYMSPEQIQGESNIDERTDLYSVGVMLFQALTGRIPFDAESINKLMFKIALEDAPPLESLVANVDPAVSAIVRTAVTRNRQHRYQTAEQFAEAVSGWLEGRPSYPVALAPVDGAQGPAHAPITGAGVSAGGTVAAAPKGLTALTPQGLMPPQQLPSVATGSPSTLSVHQQSTGGGAKIVVALISVVSVLAVVGVLFLALSGDDETAAELGLDDTAAPAAESAAAPEGDETGDGETGPEASSPPADTTATAEPTASTSAPATPPPPRPPVQPKATVAKPPPPPPPPPTGSKKVDGRKIRTGLD